MDAQNFIVEMTKALAWPGVMVFVVYALRKPILGLIPFLEELKFKEFSLRFHRRIADAIEKVEESTAIPPASSAISPERDALVRVARVSPRAAVMEAWLFLENALLDIAVAKGQIDENSRIRGSSRLGHAMLELKAFNQVDFSLFQELRKLRNEAVHISEFVLSPADAEGYVGLAVTLIDRARASNRGI